MYVRLSAHLASEGVEPSMYLSGWLLTLFAYILNIKTLVSVWTLLFIKGEKILFQIPLAILKIYQVRYRYERFNIFVFSF